MRAADRVAVPWKNGGGVTREVCAMPEGAEFDCDWRLSIAEVHASGPFSRFPGIERTLAVLNGRMHLAIGLQKPLDIFAASTPVSFSGEAHTVAKVIEPVTDANLMTRRGLFQGKLEWIAIDGAATIVDGLADTVIIVIDPVLIQGISLGPLDAIWCESGHSAAVEALGDRTDLLVAKIRRVTT